MTRPFQWYHEFGHVILTMTFHLHLENFNSAHNFQTIDRHTGRAFIFGNYDLYDKTFPFVLSTTNSTNDSNVLFQTILKMD